MKFRRKLNEADRPTRSVEVEPGQEGQYAYKYSKYDAPPRKDWETYPAKGDFPAQKEAGDVLGQMIVEIQQKQEAIDELQETIKEIEARKEAEKTPARKKQSALGEEVEKLVKTAFGHLAKSVGKLEAGAEHFRRYEGILLGIKESQDKSVEGKLAPAEKHKAVMAFLKEHHPEVMAECDTLLSELAHKLDETVQTPRMVATQRVQAEGRRYLRESLLSSIVDWAKDKFGAILEILHISSSIESLMGDYVDTVETFA